MSVLATNYLTPTGREEAWRFTPLKRLRGLHDGTSVQSDRSTLIAKDALPKGVTFTRENLEPLAESDDVIIERIRSFSPSVAHLSIAANTEVAEPIFLGRSAGALDTAEFSRVRISLGTHAVATVIVENTTDTILAEDLEIALAPGSNLKFVTLQEFESKSVYTARHHAVVDKDATFKSVTVTVGGDVVRILPTVEFIAPGGSVDLLGVYFATAGQFFEHRMHVDHAVPHAKSNVNFKGALAGQGAHTVWIGDVLIRAAAEGTDTYELNRNLLLSDGARAD
jgi:Fe-S cluster assembly protein SufD